MLGGSILFIASTEFRELDKRTSLASQLVLEIQFHLPSSGIICELLCPSDISEGPGDPNSILHACLAKDLTTD